VHDPEHQRAAAFFRTLGHPTRIRILELLARRDHAVHEMLEALDAEPSNLSHQLAVLRQAGLVASRRQDGQVVYSARVAAVGELVASARTILRAQTSPGQG
jgi:ArsR family transcriptional regulator